MGRVAAGVTRAGLRRAAASGRGAWRPVHERYITVASLCHGERGEAALRAAGGGEPLLLIHGWPGFWFEWHKNIDALARHYDVIVPDMRGFAYSDKPDLPPEVGYTDTAFAEDLRAFADFYHLDNLRIVSHDFGAIWVQRFARLYPERLHKLMLFDPPYPGIGGRMFELPAVFNVWYQMFHQQPWAEELVGSSAKATEIYLRHFLSAWSADKNLWTDDEIAAYVEAYSQPGALRGGFNCYRAAYRGGAYGGRTSR